MTLYECYKTPDEITLFDFREAWNDYRGADGYSILGNPECTDYLTPEVEEMVGDWRSDGLSLANVANELARRHGEPYRCGTLTGCVQRDWQCIVYPARFEGELKLIEQEYFNLCDEWNCVPRDGSEDGFYCFTYPLVEESTEEQLRNICMCDEVELYVPRQVYVWA